MLKDRMEQLKKEIIEFSLHVEKMIENSIEGLLKKDEKALSKIITEDEPIANQYENKIDEACIATIAQFEPRAKDLRTVIMILKMNNDLERIGDLAVNIVESALYLIKRPEVKPLIDIPRMAKTTIGMLKDAIDSFMKEDVEKAKDVCQRDEIVDSLRDQILRELVVFMISDPQTIERSIHLIRISRSLERAADLSTNIAEDVIFMAEGKVVKHTKKAV